MSQVPVLELLQTVAQTARRCPNPTLVHAYVRAARKFCIETRWYRLTVTGSTAADTAQYSLGEEADLEVIGIRAMSGSSTVPRQTWAINPADPTLWDPNLQSGPPRRYAYVPEGQFAVHPTPDGVYGLTITAEVTPTQAATTLPSELLVKWNRAFEDGALQELLSQPNVPWSNPALAVSYGRLLQAEINNARGQVQRAFNTGTSMARIPRRF